MFSLRRKLFSRIQSADGFSICRCLQSRPLDSPAGAPSALVMGQPTSLTHPHMVGADMLVPGLSVSEFTARRSTLMQRLCAVGREKNMLKGHTVLVPSAAKQFMSDKIPYTFRQSSDMHYLTGCLEPDSVLMMTSLPGSDCIHQATLFLRGRDQHSELWDGPRTGVHNAPQMFKVDAALPYTELVPYLTSHLSSRDDVLWYSACSPPHSEVEASVRRCLHSLGGSAPAPVCPRSHIAAQRLIKSPAEAELMHHACLVGSEAINKAMAATKSGISEHDILASLEYWSRRGGAEHLAFPPVVAGGPRATAIHYIHDNQMLSHGELLLVDAGCQRYGYNSDITRTWPVSGAFSPAQATLYDMVQQVQAELLGALHGGARPSLDRLFDSMCRKLGKYLKEEGVIDKKAGDSETLALAYNFCPHHVSHYLGMDVHDTPQIPRNIAILPGMVITMEPGIYINANDTSVPKEFRGIGIRIEDDVLITHGDPMILTDTCIKNRQQIERTVGTKSLPE